MNRELSPCERFYWYANEFSPGNVTTLAHVSGVLDAEKLRRAASQLQSIHPLLGVHVVEEPGGALWFVSDGTDAPNVRIETGACVLKDVIEGEINDSVGSEPGAPKCSPLFRCRVVAAEEPGEWIAMLTAMHMVSDAMSTMLALRDWLDGYARLLEGRELLSVRMPERAGFDELVPRAFRRKLHPYVQSARLIARVTARRRWRRAIRLNAERGVPLRQRRSVIVHRAFRTSDLEALQRHCRAQGVTLHGAFMAALALAMREVLGPSIPTGTPLVELATPASLRHLVETPIGEEVGCYVSMLHAFLTLSPDASFWDLARQAKRLVQEGLEREDHWTALELGGLMAPKTRARAAAAFDKIDEDSGFGVCVSNVANPPFPSTFGPIQLRRLSGFGALSFSGLLCVGILTYHRRTEICCMYASGTISEHTVTQIIDRFCAKLVEQGARSGDAVAASSTRAAHSVS